MSAMLAALVAGTGCWGDVPVSLVDECALDGNDAENERSPGYPYDFQVFRGDIAPLLAADCAAGGCHGEAEPPSGGNGGFVVFAGAETDECARVKTFKKFRDKVNLTSPATSRMIFALEGGELTGNVRHPLDYTASDDGQARLDAIVAFIEQASATCVAGGGCAPDVRDFFDLARFEAAIQPGLDAAACSAAGCHLPPDGQRGLSLPASPAPDSAEMQASYDAVKSRISLDADPRATLLYVKATQPHSGSTAVDQETADALADWIADAVAARGDADDLGCADPAQLDLAVFRDEILPILRGDVNLNPGDDQGIATGCTRGPCHGQPRPGSLTLIPTDPPEVQLANFACFVSLTSPVSSQVLLCPRNHPGCAKSPHPGDELLVGVDDLNYQRLLSFLFSAVTDVTPLDLAFYVRRIEPMFDDRGAVEGSARTCADTSQCHGIAAAGGAPPNGANLAIISGPAEDMNRLRANFTEASAFINFLSPDQSSLFLYPTNEIADLDNPAATGFPHPGGAGLRCRLAVRAGHHHLRPGPAARRRRVRAQLAGGRRLSGNRRHRRGDLGQRGDGHADHLRRVERHQDGRQVGRAVRGQRRGQHRRLPRRRGRLRPRGLCGRLSLQHDRDRPGSGHRAQLARRRSLLRRRGPGPGRRRRGLPGRR